MVAGCATHAATGAVAANVNLCGPVRIRKTVKQTLSVLTLIFFAPDGAFVTPVIAGANTVLLIMRILRRQIAVEALHLTQRREGGGGGNMTDLPPDGIHRQRLGLIKTVNLMAVRQNDGLMAGGFT